MNIVALLKEMQCGSFYLIVKNMDGTYTITNSSVVDKMTQTGEGRTVQQALDDEQ